MDTTKTITHLSLCSGYEGIGIGLRTVMPNVRECAFVEIEAFNVANLVAKMEEGKIHPTPIYTNLKTFPYRKFRGCVDILSGGFPCQPFSNAGKRKATKDPRHLFPYIADGIRECQPKFIFLENVEGIISAKTADGESVLKYVLRRLEELGYTATAGIFSACEVGAPHQRKRVYILGMANTNSGGRNKNLQSTQLWTNWLEQSSSNCWPARPGETQKRWEAPRVVADTKGKQSASNHNGRKQKGTSQPKQSQPGGGCGRSLWESNRQTKSELGGTVDGTANRVDATANRLDRLRACGNGVVPQTAAKAFKTLINRLI